MPYTESQGIWRNPRPAVPGNIDLASRPLVKDGDGIATVRSMSIGTPEGDVLLPTVHPDGFIMDDDSAIRRYELTGQHLGIFKSPADASAYANRLHLEQQDMYGDMIRSLLAN